MKRGRGRRLGKSSNTCFAPLSLCVHDLYLNQHEIDPSKEAPDSVCLAIVLYYHCRMTVKKPQLGEQSLRNSSDVAELEIPPTKGN